MLLLEAEVDEEHMSADYCRREMEAAVDVVHKD